MRCTEEGLDGAREDDEGVDDTDDDVEDNPDDEEEEERVLSLALLSPPPLGVEGEGKKNDAAEAAAAEGKEEEPPPPPHALTAACARALASSAAAAESTVSSVFPDGGKSSEWGIVGAPRYGLAAPANHGCFKTASTLRHRKSGRSLQSLSRRSTKEGENGARPCFLRSRERCSRSFPRGVASRVEWGRVGPPLGVRAGIEGVKTGNSSAKLLAKAAGEAWPPWPPTTYEELCVDSEGPVQL